MKMLNEREAELIFSLILVEIAEPLNCHSKMSH